MENKKDKKKVKNEKAKNIIWKVVHGISYVLSGCFIAVCCFACANQGKNNKTKNNDVVYFEEHQELKVLPKYVSYDDEGYEIELSLNEINSYKFPNLSETYIDTNVNQNNFKLSYDSYLYLLSSNGTINYYTQPGGTYAIYLIYNSDVFDFVSNMYNVDCELYSFVIFDNDDEVQLSFDNSLTLVLSDSIYDDFKASIELDIEANSGDINSGIFETLTESVVDFVDVLGNGLNDMVGIFYNTTTNQLTVIGTLMSIVVAVSFGYFLFRLISSYVRLRG